MSCQAILKSGPNAGNQCSRNAKENSLYCGSHANYKPQNKSKKIDILDQRLPDAEWIYKEEVKLREFYDDGSPVRLKSVSKYKIIDNLMNVKQEDSNDTSAPKPRQNIIKEPKQDIILEPKITIEDIGSADDIIQDSDDYDEYSDESSDGIYDDYETRKRRIKLWSPVIKTGIVHTFKAIEAVIKEEAEYNIEGAIDITMKDKIANDAIDALIQEYIPDILLEEDNPMIDFFMVYMVSAGVMYHKNNLKKEQQTHVEREYIPPPDIIQEPRERIEPEVKLPEGGPTNPEDIERERRKKIDLRDRFAYLKK